MGGAEFTALGIVAVLGLWMLGAHNRLVRLRQAIAAAFAQVDALLRQRHQLLAELIEASTIGLAHAHELLAAAEAARQQARVAAEQAARRPASAGRLASLVLAEQVMRTSVSRLLAAIGASPALDADERVRAATAGLTALDHRLGAAREAFNAEVAVYNAGVRQFPTRIVAALFRFRPAGAL